MNRKDLAANHTRNLIIDYEAVKPISVKNFRSIEEVAITSWCLFRTIYHPAPEGSCVDTQYSDFNECLTTLASINSSPIPTHVTLHISESIDGENVLNLLLYKDPPVPMTFDIYSDTVWEEGDVLRLAYYTGGVVLFAVNSLAQDNLITALADRLNFPFEVEEEFEAPSSKLYICDIAKHALSPEELETARGKANEAVEVKLFKSCTINNAKHDLTESQKWAHFKSRVNLVDIGFRPTPAEVAEIMQGRSVAYQTAASGMLADAYRQYIHDNAH
jgi:hypothetical protein